MRFAYSSGDRPLDGFTIKRGLGTGGFGEVYFALTDAGKEVALKHVRRHQEIERRGVSQCLNLKHANLVGVYDIREDAHGDTWIVMEYIADGSLRDVLDKRPSGLPAEEVRRWFDGVAAGLGLLHERGLVHRDLKPGNIFQDENIVKIGDYGLSKLLSNSQVGGQTESVGTFHYTAPEVSRGSYGRSIDIYSLGVILYEMLTGDVPFDGESAQEIIMKHLTATPDWNRVPLMFRPVVERALAKDPAQRYATVAEFSQAFSSAMSGETVYDAAVLDRPYHATGAANPAQGGPGSGPYAPRAPGFFDDEPIYQLGCRLAASTQQWLGESRMDNTSRTIVLVVLAVVAYFNAAWLLPLATIAGMFYAVYLGVRWLVWFPAKPSAPPSGVDADSEPQAANPAGYQPAGYQPAGYQPAGYQPLGYQPAGFPGSFPAGFPPANQAMGPAAAYAVGGQGPAVAVPPGYLHPPATQTGPAPPGFTPPGYAPPMTPPPGYAPPGYAPPGYAPPGYAPPGLSGVPLPAPRAKRPLRVSVRTMTHRKTFRERFQELSGSWLMAAFVAAFLAGGGALLFENGKTPASTSSQSLFPEHQGSVQLIDMAARAAWMWGGTTLGAWLLLTLGKLWEKDSGSNAHRRLTMAIGGVLLGVAIAALANYLGLNRTPLPGANVPLLAELLPLNTRSPWFGYPLLFGLLFLMLRWWREADALRSSRFSFWNTIVDVVAALAVSQFVSVGSVGQWFLPAAISISVQLSASWIDLEARARFREQATGEAVI